MIDHTKTLKEWLILLNSFIPEFLQQKYKIIEMLNCYLQDNPSIVHKMNLEKLLHGFVIRLTINQFISLLWS